MVTVWTSQTGFSLYMSYLEDDPVWEEIIIHFVFEYLRVVQQTAGSLRSGEPVCGFQQEAALLGENVTPGSVQLPIVFSLTPPT